MSTIASKAAAAPTAPLLPLDIYLNNVFYLLAIQEHDDIAELTLERNFSPNVEEINAGTRLNFAQYRAFVWQLRTGFTNRQVISNQTLAAPDADGRTGTVGHAQTFEALQDGVRVSVSSMAVATIGWNEEQGRRECVMESFVSKVTVL